MSTNGCDIPHWDRCAPWLAAALARAGHEHTLAAVETRIAAGTAILWPGDAAALVTEVENGELHAWLAGGALAGILAMIPGLEAWGRAAGCRAATLRGRPGWGRVLAPLGYALRACGPDGAELRKVL